MKTVNMVIITFTITEINCYRKYCRTPQNQQALKTLPELDLWAMTLCQVQLR